MSRKPKSEYAKARDAAFRLAKKKLKHAPESEDDMLLWLDHAMKVDLGFVGYRDFYTEILLQAVKDLGLGVSEKIALNKMLDEDLFGIETIEERVVGEHCKHAISDNGALYRVSMKIPPKGVAPKSKVFVKRCVDSRTWEKSMLMEKYLAKECIASRFVPEVKYSDRRRRLLGYEFIDGEPLSELFKDPTMEEMLHGKSKLTPEEKESMLRQSIEAIMLLSYSVAPPTETSHHRGRYGSEQYLLEKDGNKVEISVGDKTHRLRSINNSMQSLLRMFVIRGNPALENRLTSWDGKVSKRALDGMKKQYKSVQPLLDAYKEISDILDTEELCFTHGDLHLANILWTEEGPKIIDWEYAVMALRQFDLLKLLKKGGVSKEAEERLLRYAFMVHETAGLRDRIASEKGQTINKLKADGTFVTEETSKTLKEELKDACASLLTSKEAEVRFAKFRKVYNTLEFHENLLSAAKYLNFSDKSDTPERRQELAGMASFYYTKALNYVRGTGLEKRIKDVAAEVHEARLVDFGRNIDSAPNPLTCMSMSNLNYPSIIEKVDGKKPTKPRIIRAAKCGVAAAVLASLVAFGVSAEINKRESQKLIDSIGIAVGEGKELPHSGFVGKYARMYSIDPMMLHAAVAYVVLNREPVNLGAAEKYRHDPEQLTMSIAKRMHDIAKTKGDDYPAIFAELYAGKQEAEKATRLSFTGKYVDFRRMSPRYSTKVACTLASSGYYAKMDKRRIAARWRR